MAKSLPYVGLGDRDICRSSAAAASAADWASKVAIIDMDLYVTEEPALAFCLLCKEIDQVDGQSFTVTPEGN